MLTESDSRDGEGVGGVQGRGGGGEGGISECNGRSGERTLGQRRGAETLREERRGESAPRDGWLVIFWNSKAQSATPSFSKSTRRSHAGS